MSITNDGASQGDVALQTGDNICGLLFLIPTDSSVEQQNTNNYTEINPVAKTSGEEDCKLHN